MTRGQMIEPLFGKVPPEERPVVINDAERDRVMADDVQSRPDRRLRQGGKIALVPHHQLFLAMEADGEFSEPLREIGMGHPLEHATDLEVRPDLFARADPAPLQTHPEFMGEGRRADREGGHEYDDICHYHARRCHGNFSEFDRLLHGYETERRFGCI